VLIACVDGLKGFPEAIEATFRHAWVQTCIVHLIRASLRYVNYRDQKKIASALRPIYTAPNAEAALAETVSDRRARRNASSPAAGRRSARTGRSGARRQHAGRPHGR
jgi:putative transposase